MKNAGGLSIHYLFLHLVLYLQGVYSWGAEKRWSPSEDGISTYSGIIIPGFASSRMRAWAMLDCPYTPLDFAPLDSVWLDTSKVMGATSCWLRCIMLNQTTQDDNPDCRSRPDTGLNSITELDPGYITGPLSSVWREWVNWVVEFGIPPEGIIAVPYDWRLFPAKLESRDLFFHKLKAIFEGARKHRGGPALVFAHSMGNNVFRYFLEWLKHAVAPREYQSWIDYHIYAYHAIAGPHLGAPEAVKGFFTGLTFGLPITETTARVMGNSFGASMWMYPFSPFCGLSYGTCSPNQRPSGKKHPQSPAVQCGPGEYLKNASGWPVHIVTLDHHAGHLSESGSSPEASPEPSAQYMNDVFDADRLYTAGEVGSGTVFDETSGMDKDSETFAEKLRKWYLEDPVLNPLTPWERPPIKNVYCQYGINVKTEVGYAYAPSGKPFPANWQLSDVYYEGEGGALTSRSGAPVFGNKFPASGDITVPYVSLSWCKQWLGARVNITRAPMEPHDEAQVQKAPNTEHVVGQAGIYEDLYPKEFTRAAGHNYITFYEDSESLDGRKTAVWELDKVDHRNIVQNSVLLKEVFLEVLHNSHPSPLHPFVNKDYREPMRDEDCFWDYPRAKCALSHACEYRYVFGDIHLGQSCRLRVNNETNHFARYL